MQRDGDDGALAHHVPLLRPLFEIGDERDPAKARRTDCPHDPHDDAVIHPAVAAHENALVESSFGDSSEFGHNFVDLKFGFLEEDLSVRIDGDGERFLVAFERASTSATRSARRR